MLPSLNEFQRKLEDFYQSVTRPKLKEKQDYIAYITAIYEYREKGMSMREIASATGINFQTVAYWLRKKGAAKNGSKKAPEGDSRHA